MLTMICICCRCKRIKSSSYACISIHLPTLVQITKKNEACPLVSPHTPNQVLPTCNQAHLILSHMRLLHIMWKSLYCINRKTNNRIAIRHMISSTLESDLRCASLAELPVRLRLRLRLRLRRRRRRRRLLLLLLLTLPTSKF